MTPSESFTGFPEGQVRHVPVPGPFFSELLPAIDHLGELKLTLYAFWALGRKHSPHPHLRRSELLADELLLAGLKHASLEGAAALDDALERCVGRGSLLKLHAKDGSDEAYYFLNSPKGRAAAQAAERGEWQPGTEDDVALELERPNIFLLYEKNIGPLTPMIAEALRDAETSFPMHWIEDALRIAVNNNIRKWAYVQAILDDWQTRGRDDREDRRDSEKARRRYLESYEKYRDS